MSQLIPDYMNIDFNTLVSRLRTQISESNTFKDVNYEGSNINILIELFAYIGELNTYFLNKLAKNTFADTADTYENVHRLVSLLGYKPKGYVSSSGDLSITITGTGLANKVWRIPRWTQFKTENITDDDGNVIYFASTQEITGFSSTDTVTFTNIPIKQGEIVKFLDETNTSYTGSDLIDNRLSLPLYNFGYDDNLDDDEPSIVLFVNGIEWIRIADFYEDVSGLTYENNVYTLEYNKYKEYIISFSPFRNVPVSDDKIEIWALKSIGSQGNVTANSITSYYEDEFIIDVNSNPINMDLLDSFTITNPSAVNGGSDPEIVNSIKENAKSIIHTQYRNVTKSDYKTYLELYNDIEKAIVWGEQEENPDGGNVWDYNKVYICCIPPGTPDTWVNKISTNNQTYTNPFSGIESTIYIPTVDGYNNVYKYNISSYLEPRKMLCAYEQYIIPELIYLKFNIDLKIKRNYKYSEVKRDTEAKLIYYFDSKNRLFNETISFTDIMYTLMDMSYVDEENSNDFLKTAGLMNVIIRDIEFYDVIGNTYINPYEYNNSGNYYPQFTEVTNSNYINDLRNIQLGYKQFPILDNVQCNWSQINY